MKEMRQSESDPVGREAATPGTLGESPALSADRRAPVQAWRAWAGCGDGRQIHLIIDLEAQQVWLLSADDSNFDPRSMR